MFQQLMAERFAFPIGSAGPLRGGTGGAHQQCKAAEP